MAKSTASHSERVRGSTKAAETTAPARTAESREPTLAREGNPRLSRARRLALETQRLRKLGVVQ